jgi:hypothetical protein
MRIVVDAAIAVRSEAGLLYGVLRAVNGARVAFELDGTFLPGELVDLQVELAGVGRTMVVQAEILEALGRKRAPSRYIANIDFRSPADSSLFGTWLEEVWRAGGSAQPEPAVAGPQPFQPKPLEPDEVESALRRLDASPSVDRLSASQTTAPSDVRFGVGREAVRQALHFALARDLAEHLASPAFKALATIPSVPPVEVRQAPRMGIFAIERIFTLPRRARRA